MEPRIIIAIVAIAVVILLIAFWPFGSKSAVHSNTPAVPVTSVTTGSQAAPTTTVPTGPVKTEFYAINYQWVYSGPTAQNKSQCYYSSHTSYIQQTTILNGSQNFYLTIAPSTDICGFRINSINSSSNGFTVVSTNPSLPYTLPPNSDAEMQVNLRAPSVDYFGPLTITIHYS